MLNDSLPIIILLLASGGINIWQKGSHVEIQLLLCLTPPNAMILNLGFTFRSALRALKSTDTQVPSPESWCNCPVLTHSFSELGSFFSFFLHTWIQYINEFIFKEIPLRCYMTIMIWEHDYISLNNYIVTQGFFKITQLDIFSLLKLPSGILKTSMFCWRHQSLALGKKCKHAYNFSYQDLMSTVIY